LAAVTLHLAEVLDVLDQAARHLLEVKGVHLKESSEGVTEVN